MITEAVITCTKPQLHLNFYLNSAEIANLSDLDLDLQISKPVYFLRCFNLVLFLDLSCRPEIFSVKVSNEAGFL